MYNTGHYIVYITDWFSVGRFIWLNTLGDFTKPEVLSMSASLMSQTQHIEAKFILYQHIEDCNKVRIHENFPKKQGDGINL